MKHSVPNFKITPSSALHPRHRSEGFVVIASLLILIILTLIQLTMSRGYWLQEIMGGNTREKARALNAAESASRYAEWWLQQSTTGKTGIPCNTAGNIANVQICTTAVALNNNVASANTTPLTMWTDFKDADSTFLKNVNISTSGGAGMYYRHPGFYVQFLKGSLDGSASYYKITAFGYGGNSNSAAVTQTLYQVDFTTNAKGTKVTNLGGL